MALLDTKCKEKTKLKLELLNRGLHLNKDKLG